MKYKVMKQGLKYYHFKIIKPKQKGEEAYNDIKSK